MAKRKRQLNPDPTPNLLVLEEWTQTIAGREVRFEALRNMYLRQDGGPAKPIVSNVDYDTGVVQLWAGLSPARAARITAMAAERFCRIAWGLEEGDTPLADAA